MTCGYLHSDHAYNGNIPFSGITDDSPLTLVSFFIVILHLYCLPDRVNDRKWVLQKKESISFKAPKPLRRTHCQDIFFRIFKISMISMICSIGYTAISLVILAEIFPNLAPIPYLLTAVVFFIYALLNSLGLYIADKTRKHS